MNNAIRLAKMGCGSEIVNSIIDRGNIHAAISNAKTFLKYYKYAVKEGLYKKEQAMQGYLPYYNKLLAIEHIANLYHELWGEQFVKIKLQSDNFINN